MLLPNKNITYTESTLSKFPILLTELRKSPLKVTTLYSKVYKSMGDINEFISALTCLYTLGKIEYNKDKGELTYVN